MLKGSNEYSSIGEMRVTLDQRGVIVFRTMRRSGEVLMQDESKASVQTLLVPDGPLSFKLRNQGNVARDT